jgi:geranylgeranyl diphosphate synthase type 3
MRLLSMLCLIRQTATDCALTDVLKQRPTDEATKAWAVGYMRDETQSFEYTRTVVLQLKEQALQEIGRLGGHKMLERILDTIAPSKVMTNGSDH